MNKSLTLFIHPIMTTSWWSYHSSIGLDMWILLVSNYLEDGTPSIFQPSYTLIQLWVHVVSLIYIPSSCNKTKSLDITYISYLASYWKQTFQFLTSPCFSNKFENIGFKETSMILDANWNHCSLDFESRGAIGGIWKVAIGLLYFLDFL